MDVLPVYRRKRRYLSEGSDRDRYLHPVRWQKSQGPETRKESPRLTLGVIEICKYHKGSSIKRRQDKEMNLLMSSILGSKHREGRRGLRTQRQMGVFTLVISIHISIYVCRTNHRMSSWSTVPFSTQLSRAKGSNVRYPRYQSSVTLLSSSLFRVPSSLFCDRHGGLEREVTRTSLLPSVKPGTEHPCFFLFE